MPSDIDVDGVTVRPETPADTPAIHALIEAAFDSPLESKLVDRLREDGDLVLSLVAAQGDKIVGYAGFSRLRIEDRSQRAVALAPVAVMRCFRRRGVASRLIRVGIRQLEEAGEELVFVLGDPPYYQRFGFDAQVARQFCAQWSGPAFMALSLDTQASADSRPKVIYPPAFETFG